MRADGPEPQRKRTNQLNHLLGIRNNLVGVMTETVVTSLKYQRHWDRILYIDLQAPAVKQKHDQIPSKRFSTKGFYLETGGPSDWMRGIPGLLMGCSL